MTESSTGNGYISLKHLSSPIDSPTTNNFSFSVPDIIVGKTFCFVIDNNVIGGMSNSLAISHFFFFFYDRRSRFKIKQTLSEIGRTIDLRVVFSPLIYEFALSQSPNFLHDCVCSRFDKKKKKKSYLRNPNNEKRLISYRVIESETVSNVIGCSNGISMR